MEKEGVYEGKINLNNDNNDNDSDNEPRGRGGSLVFLTTDFPNRVMYCVRIRDAQ